MTAVPPVVQARLLMPYILAARQQLLEEIADLAVKVDAIWPDRDAGCERSFAYLITKEFGNEYDAGSVPRTDG